MPANFQVKSRFDILDVSTTPANDTHVVRKVDLDGEVAFLESSLSTEVSRASDAEASLILKLTLLLVIWLVPLPKLLTL